MDCKTAHDLLPLYFDGELDRATSREFEAHLDGCADCRAALVALDELRRGLREDAPRYRAPRGAAPSASANAASANALADAAANSGAIESKRVHRTPSPLRFAAAIALAFAAGGTAVSLWHSPHESGTSRDQVTNDLFSSHLACARGDVTCRRHLERPPHGEASSRGQGRRCAARAGLRRTGFPPSSAAASTATTSARARAGAGLSARPASDRRVRARVGRCGRNGCVGRAQRLSHRNDPARRPGGGGRHRYGCGRACEVRAAAAAAGEADRAY